MEISELFDNAQNLEVVLESGKTARIQLMVPGLYCVFLEDPVGTMKRVYEGGTFMDAFEFLCDFGIPQLK